MIIVLILIAAVYLCIACYLLGLDIGSRKAEALDAVIIKQVGEINILKSHISILAARCGHLERDSMLFDKSDDFLYREASRIQQSNIEEYDEEMIDNIFKDLKENRDACSRSNMDTKS